MSLINTLPEDVARLVWRGVFDEVIKSINKRKVIAFYNLRYNSLNYDKKAKEKQIEGLNKRYKTCKNKEDNRKKWDKYLYELSAIELRLTKLKGLVMISLDAVHPEYFKDDKIKRFHMIGHYKKNDIKDVYEILKEIFSL